MLLAVRYLVDRSRARDLTELYRRFAAAPDASEVSAEERSIALALRASREALSAALDGVESCGTCARGHPMPHGRWTGGHCCGGPTEGVFTDDEVAALKLSGTTRGRLSAPTADHAGCAFRGPEGCSLAAADRPNLCVRYLCHGLERELGERGDLPRIKALAREIDAAFRRFVALRAARIEAAPWDISLSK